MNDCAVGRVRLSTLPFDAQDAVHIAVEQRTSDFILGVSAEALKNKFNPHGWFVYCLWGESHEAPIYVGKSFNVLGRLGKHLTNRHIRLQVEDVTLMRCRSLRHMDEAEQRLIRRYRPRLNIAGK